MSAEKLRSVTANATLAVQDPTRRLEGRRERMALLPMRSARLLAVSLTVTLSVAACGSSKSKAGSAPGTTTPSSLSGNPAIPAGPIKLGLSTPLSGPDAAYGKIIQATDQVAINYVNTLGGIAGHQ